MDIKSLCHVLDFAPKENSSGIFHKKYKCCDDYAIEVDFVKEKINYGDKIQAESKTTQNFSQKENFVVLECVDRLLTKGYKPQNIILEKTWPAGHGTSGRLDILVTRDDGSSYLMIECKTWGAEFEKELKKIEKNGGQLFTYFQQDKNADILMLYCSNLSGKMVNFKNIIIKIEEDLRQTGNVKDFHDRWNKLPKTNGVFESWVNPYNFKSRALTIKDLETIKLEDSSFIFNRFLEILRHNVVSDKPNAFNKIFTLFLCKIYDEKDKEGTDEELGFQWREGIDDDVSFQLRLTDLYKNGMKEFLEKNVTDFSESEFENKYKNLDQSVKTALLQEFKKIRLEKNNEFAIKEVYDEKSFKENAVVVKQVVELLQKYKIRYAKKQQYLSDFFELLLTTGLKQESGQFFTPVPIAQFIIKSLPIDDLVKTKLHEGKRGELLPYIIDYAAGSGHFITESMHEIQRLLDKIDITKLKMEAKSSVDTWKIRHFDWALQYIYGIEKDYRLVKVGKVGCYLHGDGLANVVHSDGLSRFSHPDYKSKLKEIDKDFPQENKQFDIVVSNPPYSVSAFKNASREYYGEDDFTLHGKLTDSSSEIECLFVERAKQLLKDGGVAGIILPSSILSSVGIYTKAREIILQYFNIIGVTELGSNTFMATGTNTVVLFLRRRNNYDSINLRKSVDHFFSTFIDITMNGVEKPVAKFVNHVWKGISFNDYLTFLKKTPNNVIEEHEIYKECRKKIKAKTEKEFWTAVLEIEKEKLYYFIIAHPQKIVLVKSGEKDAEKRFLGYEFSTRRGNEGIHPVQRAKSIDECTKLYDADSFENPQKASTYIYKAFKGEHDFEIHENLKNNITRLDLVDMLSFDRADFEKTISLAVKKKVKIESKYEIVKIGQIAQTQYGYTDKATDKGEIRYLRITDLNDDGSINLANDAKFITPSDEVKSQFLLKNNDIVIARSGSVGKSAIYKSDKYDQMIFASYLIRLIINTEKVFPHYLFNFTKTKMYWNQVEANSTAVTQPNLNAEKIKEFQIPLPPKDIQQKIVAEIEVLEKKEIETRHEIQKLQNSIVKEIEKHEFQEESLGNIVSFKNGLNYNRQSSGDIISIVGVKDFQNKFVPDLNLLEEIQIEGKLSDDYKLNPCDILVVRSNGSANLVGRFLFIEKILTTTSFSGFTIRLRPHSERVNSKYLFYYLRTEKVRDKLTKNSKGSNIKSLNQSLLSSLKVTLPSIEKQSEIVRLIEEIEYKISNLEKQIADIPKKKEQILNKYLK